MAEKRTVYLSGQALALVRPGDSLSGRLNDICERYARLRELLPSLIAHIDGTVDPWAVESMREAINDQ